MKESEGINILDSLNYQTWKQVIIVMDKHHYWKNIVTFLNNRSFTINIDKKCPSETLLNELHERICPLSTFKNILRSCEILEVLALISEPEPLIITKQPGSENETMYVMPGNDLRLECKATGLPPPSYLWYFSNIELETQTYPILHINDFRKENVGDYYCIVSQEVNNKVVSIPTESINVEILPEPPTFIEDLKKLEIIAENSSITLKVEACGSPDPSYTWLCNNEAIQGKNSNTLTLHKIKNKDQGLYRCVASNYNKLVNKLFRVESSECELKVYSQPNQASAKMALLIGNNSYDHLGNLMCTNNDVFVISEVLRKLGFHIFALMNLTLVEMINATKWFFKIVPQNAYVLFYFAGHGFEFGEKFMMPVDCPDKTYTRKDCFCDKELIQTALEASPCLLVMILDMCLQPPSEENKEIYAEKAIVYQYKPEEHDIITFTSTSSHQNAYERPSSKNGLLVQHLIKHLEEYNDVNTILRSTQEDFKRNLDSKYQKPTLISNTSTIYKLTDFVPDDEKLSKSIRALTSLSVTLNLTFSRVNFSSSIHLSHHKSCFLNSIDLVFPSAFNKWIITAEINTENSSYVWWDYQDTNNVEKNLVLTIHNIQKAKTKVCITIKLNERMENHKVLFLDYTDVELPIPISQQSLWYKKETQQ